jgi:hypothetical protein
MLLITFFCIALIIDVIIFTADRYVWSAILLFTEVAGAYLLVDSFHAYVTAEGFWMFLATAVPAYIGIGIVVAAVKWITFNVRIANRVKEMADKFRSDSTSGKNVFRQFLENFNDHQINRLLKTNNHLFHTSVSTKAEMVHQLTPQAKNYIDRIGGWIAQWPIVIIAFMFEDVILKIADIVSTIFGQVFTRFSKYLIGRAVAGIGNSSN